MSRHTKDRRTVALVDDDADDTVFVEDVTEYRPPAAADAAIVATRSDSTNPLIAQQFRLTDTDDVVRLNDQANSQAFEDIDVELVCSATRVGESLVKCYAEQRRLYR